MCVYSGEHNLSTRDEYCLTMYQSTERKRMNQLNISPPSFIHTSEPCVASFLIIHTSEPSVSKGVKESRGQGVRTFLLPNVRAAFATCNNPTPRLKLHVALPTLSKVFKNTHLLIGPRNRTGSPPVNFYDK